jgi:hypothetical protein
MTTIDCFKTMARTRSSLCKERNCPRAAAKEIQIVSGRCYRCNESRFQKCKGRKTCNVCTTHNTTNARPVPACRIKRASRSESTLPASPTVPESKSNIEELPVFRDIKDSAIKRPRRNCGSVPVSYAEGDTETEENTESEDEAASDEFSPATTDDSEEVSSPDEKEEDDKDDPHKKNKSTGLRKASSICNKVKLPTMVSPTRETWRAPEARMY